MQRNTYTTQQTKTKTHQSTIQLNKTKYNTTQHNTIQYNTIQHNSIQHKTRQDQTRQDKTRQPLHALIYFNIYIRMFQGTFKV